MQQVIFLSVYISMCYSAAADILSIDTCLFFNFIIIIYPVNKLKMDLGHITIKRIISVINKQSSTHCAGIGVGWGVELRAISKS